MGFSATTHRASLNTDVPKDCPALSFVPYTSITRGDSGSAQRRGSRLVCTMAASGKFKYKDTPLNIAYGSAISSNQSGRVYAVTQFGVLRFTPGDDGRSWNADTSSVFPPSRSLWSQRAV